MYPVGCGIGPATRVAADSAVTIDPISHGGSALHARGDSGYLPGRMADKQTPLILEALARAAAEPAGVSPYASKAETGLFPNTAIGKAAAKRCLDEQMLQTLPANGTRRELCTITDRGLRHLAEQGSPKTILEDFVRVIEDRRGQVEELLQTAGRMARNLEGLQTALAAVLPRVESARLTAPVNRITESFPNGADLGAAILTHLTDWRSDAARDCPLPELYRAVACGRGECSIGRFHDALRQLHDAGRIYLHPWTGPLYALPEPGYALLAGHNVAYYASAR
jgi:hypothetical protein